jgi:CRP/FNR family transcriptional regulator
MVPAKVWRAPKIKLLELLGQDPGMLYYLLNNAFVGLSVLMIHMESQVYGNAQRKVASVLSILAKFYGRRVNGVLQLTLPLTHQLLASMVGLARETTSREVVSLKKARVIDYAGQHIKVLNESALRKIAGTYLDHIKVGVMQASD